MQKNNRYSNETKLEVVKLKNKGFTYTELRRNLILKVLHKLNLGLKNIEMVEKSCYFQIIEEKQVEEDLRKILIHRKKKLNI